MSHADDIFIDNIKTILNSGYSTINDKVRPHWADDNAPAYTYKAFGIVNRYNLAEEFPMYTQRYINFKAAVDEILWIWQKKSNNVHDLNSHIWDAWADENRSMNVDVSAPDHSYTRYMEDVTVELTQTKQHYSFEYVMEKEDDPNARIEFNMGNFGSSANIYIQNVRYEQVN